MMLTTTTVLLISLTSAVNGLPFVYVRGEPKDPGYVALLREALTHIGMSPNGIKILTVSYKWGVTRTTYKATYTNNRGQACYLMWRIDNFFGTQVPAMPICENIAIGEGHPKSFIRYPPNYEVVNYSTNDQAKKKGPSSSAVPKSSSAGENPAPSGKEPAYTPRKSPYADLV